MAIQVWAWDVSDGRRDLFNVSIEGEDEMRMGVGRDELVSIMQEHRALLHFAAPQRGSGVGAGDYGTLPGFPDLDGVAVHCPVTGCGFKGLTWTWDAEEPPACPTHHVPLVQG